MKEQSGYKYLFKNIGLLTLSSFATKLLAFFLVPLYTSILTTAEYGTYDLISATVSVLLPILTLNIQEAVIRFLLDKKSSREAIVSISVKYLIISNTIVIVGLIVNQLAGVNRTVANYSSLFFLIFLTHSISGILSSYIRGIDKVADLSLSSVITSFVTIVCNIVFLVFFKWGLRGYFIANIVGPAVQCIYLIIRSDFVGNIRFKKYDNEEKEMTAYSKPMIANSIAWWVNSVSDRFVIVFFCGLADNGVYSVASKIPGILNIFQTIFNQAWTMSAVKDFDSEDNNGFFSNTYRAYNCMMTIICSGIILFDKILARFLYSKDFYLAWKYVPWLTIAIVFGAMSGYLGGFFSAVKDSKMFAVSTMMGAITNIILNLIFTPIYKAMGAAVATTICYVVVFVIRFWQSKKYIKLRINIVRDIISYVLLTIQASLMIIISGWKSYVYVGIIFMIICIMYAKDITLVVNKLKKKE